MFKARTGGSSNRFEESLDEIPDFWVTFSPHGDGNFLEDVLFWGGGKNPLHSGVTEFRVFVFVKEDWENAFLERFGVFLQKSGDSRHGGGSDGSLLVVVEEDGKQFLG